MKFSHIKEYAKFSPDNIYVNEDLIEDYFLELKDNWNLKEYKNGVIDFEKLGNGYYLFTMDRYHNICVATTISICMSSRIVLNSRKEIYEKYPGFLDDIDNFKNRLKSAYNIESDSTYQIKNIELRFKSNPQYINIDIDIIFENKD